MLASGSGTAQKISIQGHQHRLSAKCPLIYQGFTGSSYSQQKIRSQSRKPLRCILDFRLVAQGSCLIAGVTIQDPELLTGRLREGCHRAVVTLVAALKSNSGKEMKKFDGLAEGCKPPYRIYAANHDVSVALRICSRATNKPWLPSPGRWITMLMRPAKVLEKVAIQRTIPNNNSLLLQRSVVKYEYEYVIYFHTCPFQNTYITMGSATKL